METISNQLDTIGKIVSFTSSANVADELKKLTELRNANSLTEEEFAHQRKKLLANDILTSQNRLSKDITFRCSRCDNQFKVKEGMQYPEHCPHCGYISS
jgi:rubrerythrin